MREAGNQATEANYNMVDGQVNNLKKFKRGKSKKEIGAETKPIIKKET